MRQNVKPSYYKAFGTNMECWDVWDAMGILESACVAIVIKYLWRYGRKDSEYIEDLYKARTYLDKLIDSVEKELETAEKERIHHNR